MNAIYTYTSKKTGLVVGSGEYLTSVLCNLYRSTKHRVAVAHVIVFIDSGHESEELREALLFLKAQLTVQK